MNVALICGLCSKAEASELFLNRIVLRIVCGADDCVYIVCGPYAREHWVGLK